MDDSHIIRRIYIWVSRKIEYWLEHSEKAVAKVHYYKFRR